MVDRSGAVVLAVLLAGRWSLFALSRCTDAGANTLLLIKRT